jgi:LPS O-antigen subunit length determinant protein (WzzB/FepE family)
MIESNQKTPQDNPNPFDDRIDLRELFQVLWKGAIVIILITSAVAISSIVYSLQLTNYYQSESILLVRNNAQNQGTLSQYSGVASMIGVSLPTSGVEKVNEAIELIQSRRFVKHLITFENILPSIMAAESYDSVSNKLYFNSNIFDSETNTWQGEPNEKGIIKPSYLEAHRAYGGLISVSQDKMTGFISIKVEHISPVFAKDFLELIIQEANTLLRNRDMQESNQALQYLKIELSKTSYVEIRDSINSLIEAQLETQMLAKINKEYSLAKIEPPFIPDQKSKPIRSIIVIIATFFGGVLSVMTVLVRHYFFRGRQQT